MRGLPTAGEWLTWRDSLPEIGDWPDLRQMSGPTNRNRRTVLTTIQGGLCAVCLSRPPLMELDHDHDTGLARGMTCRGCNVRIGKYECTPWFGGSQEHADLIGLYLDYPPAAGAGWVWDTDGWIARVMLARERAAHRVGGISCIAPPDLRWPIRTVFIAYLDLNLNEDDAAQPLPATW